MITVKYLKDDAPSALRRPLAADDLSQYTQALRDGWYADVAQVEGDDLELAYKLLQNGVVTDSWTLQPPQGLTPLMPPIEHDGQKYGNRSAMIGDLFDLDGKLFVCAMMGFQRIPDLVPPTEIFADRMEEITVAYDKLRQAERARHQAAMDDLQTAELKAVAECVAECRKAIREASKTLLGTGILTWGMEERVSNRYGAFTLSPESFNRDAYAPVSYNGEALAAAKLIGTKVKITCRVTESRESGHAGDKALRLVPVQPEVGAVIEVGVGILAIESLSFENPVPAIVLRPEEARDELWIDPRRLYQLHDQTVEVYVEATDEPCTPQADLVARSGSWANGDGTLQTKRIKLHDRMKIAPQVRPLGGGAFELDMNFADGDPVTLVEPAVEPIDWKSVPKQALVDALRNSSGNCGLSNLGQQDKPDLVEAANRLLDAGAETAANFRANLDREVAFRRGKGS